MTKQKKKSGNLQKDLHSALFKQIYNQKLSKGDQRRTAIALTAYDLVDRLGVENLTFDAVGAILKLKSAHITYYYKSKRDLLVAVFKILVIKVQEYYVQALESQEGYSALIKAYVTAAFEGLIAQPNSQANVSLLFYYAGQDRECRDIYLKAKEAGVERIAVILKQNSKLRSIASEKIEKLADEILVMLHGRILQCVIYRDDKVTRSFRERSIRDVERMVSDVAI